MTAMKRKIRERAIVATVGDQTPWDVKLAVKWSDLTALKFKCSIGDDGVYVNAVQSIMKCEISNLQMWEAKPERFRNTIFKYNVYTRLYTQLCTF